MEIHFSIGKRVRHCSGAEGSDHSEASEDAEGYRATKAPTALAVTPKCLRRGKKCR